MGYIVIFHSSWWDSYSYQLSSTYTTFTLFIFSKTNTSRGRCSAFFSPIFHIPHLQKYNIYDTQSLLNYSKWHTLNKAWCLSSGNDTEDDQKSSFETYLLAAACHNYIRNTEYRHKFVVQAICPQQASMLGSLRAIKACQITLWSVSLISPMEGFVHLWLPLARQQRR